MALADSLDAEIDPGRVFWIHGSLAFVAGFVDLTGFVALQGLFSAHVTGNIVLIGAEIARGTATGVVGKLLVLPMFLTAVAATRLVVAGCARANRSPVRLLLFVEAAFLCAFLALGWAGRPITDADALLPLLAGMAAACAMGIQSAQSRLILPTLPPTSVMTGNMTQAMIDFVDLFHGDAADRQAARQRLYRIASAIVPFAAGAILGALAFAHTGLVSLAVPIAILVLLGLSGPPRAPAGR